MTVHSEITSTRAAEDVLKAFPIKNYTWGDVYAEVSRKLDEIRLLI